MTTDKQIYHMTIDNKVRNLYELCLIIFGFNMLAANIVINYDYRYLNAEIEISYP